MTAAKQARYRVRLASNEADVKTAQALRYSAFQPANDNGTRSDKDVFDAACDHYLIEDQLVDELVATFRVLPLGSGSEIDRCYSAQFYDLSAMRGFPAPMLELGRFCVAPGKRDPEILRMAWGALTRKVDRLGAGLIFGCSSFKGTEFSQYSHAFAMLKQQHLAPRRYLPKIKAPEVLQYAKQCARTVDRAEALRTMPPLLRSYLSMGGWVSDHAVVDTVMNTLHVFTGLEVGRIPPARVRVLRAVAG